MSEAHPPGGAPSVEKLTDLFTVHEMFHTRWGDLGFRDEERIDIWLVASDHASLLPYHNLQHAINTLWAAMELADKLEADGYAINRRVLFGAALFHDTDY